MKKLVCIILCMFSVLALAAEEELYVVATGSCRALKYSAVKDSGIVTHNFYCYPLQLDRETYDQKFVKKAYEELISKKVKGKKIGEVEVQEFKTKKEAQEYYKSVSKGEYSNRLPLLKSSIDKFRELHMQKNGIVEKKKDAPFVPEQVRKKKAAGKRAYHDIYD